MAKHSVGNNTPNSPWIGDEGVIRVASLRQLWTEGVSTSEIGRRLGFSKNAIVGKAHRLELDGRPSPIRREYPKGKNTKSVAVKMKKVATLPPFSHPTIEPSPEVVVSFETPIIVQRTHVALPPRFVAEVVKPDAQPVRRQCEWFEGVKKPWWQCLAPAVFGKAWCKDHYKIVYGAQPVRRREDLAA